MAKVLKLQPWSEFELHTIMLNFGLILLGKVGTPWSEIERQNPRIAASDEPTEVRHSGFFPPLLKTFFDFNAFIFT